MSEHAVIVYSIVPHGRSTKNVSEALEITNRTTPAVLAEWPPEQIQMSTIKNSKPILVTGSHRSGSTWTGRIISAAPHVGYIHEPFNIGINTGVNTQNARIKHGKQRQE